MISDAHPLQPIFHPRWKPADDMRLLRLKSDGVPTIDIADLMKCRHVAILQRLHRLNSVRDVRVQLNIFAQENKRYPVEFWNPNGTGDEGLAP